MKAEQHQPYLHRGLTTAGRQVAAASAAMCQGQVQWPGCGLPAWLLSQAAAAAAAAALHPVIGTQHTYKYTTLAQTHAAGGQ